MLRKVYGRSEIESPSLTSWGFSLTPTEHEGLNRRVSYLPILTKRMAQLSPGPVWLGLFIVARYSGSVLPSGDYAGRGTHGRFVSRWDSDFISDRNISVTRSFCANFALSTVVLKGEKFGHSVLLYSLLIILTLTA